MRLIYIYIISEVLKNSLINFKKVVDKYVRTVVRYYPLPHRRPLNKNCRNIVNKRFLRRRTLITK